MPRSSRSPSARSSSGGGWPGVAPADAVAVDHRHHDRHERRARQPAAQQRVGLRDHLGRARRQSHVRASMKKRTIALIAGDLDPLAADVADQHARARRSAAARGRRSRRRRPPARTARRRGRASKPSSSGSGPGTKPRVSASATRRSRWKSSALAIAPAAARPNARIRAAARRRRRPGARRRRSGRRTAAAPIDERHVRERVDRPPRRRSTARKRSRSASRLTYGSPVCGDAADHPLAEREALAATRSEAPIECTTSQVAAGGLLAAQHHLRRAAEPRGLRDDRAVDVVELERAAELLHGVVEHQLLLRALLAGSSSERSSAMPARLANTSAMRRSSSLKRRCGAEREREHAEHAAVRRVGPGTASTRRSRTSPTSAAPAPAASAPAGAGAAPSAPGQPRCRRSAAARRARSRPR